MDWGKLLQEGGIPDSPGRAEVVLSLKENPPKKVVRKAKGKKR